MWLPTNYGNLLIDRYSTGIQCTVGYTGGCKLTICAVSIICICACRTLICVKWSPVRFQRWRNSLLFMFIFVYYSAWNIPIEHLHLCIPRCDQTLIYNHLCIPRCIVYPLNIYLSRLLAPSWIGGKLRGNHNCLLPEYFAAAILTTIETTKQIIDFKTYLLKEIA